jgi:hypothetical protein
MASPDPADLRLIAAYGQRLDTIRSTTGARVGQAWRAVGGLTDAQAAAFVARAVPVALGGQAAVATLTEAFLAAFLGVPAGGLPTDEVTGAAVRNGTDMDAVYHRMAVTARGQIARGKSLSEAMDVAHQRAVTTGETDVLLAHRAAASRTMEANTSVVGYRRVLTGRSCMFCATASTQRYRTGDLMPIHAHCDCRIAPIVGDRDPGRVVNKALVSQLKEAGGSQYWKSRGLVEVDDEGRMIVATEDGPKPLQVETENHGELGPVLVDRRQNFDGPADVETAA